MCLFSYFTVEADFNSSPFNVVFPADEGLNTVADVDAFISIVDDEINEHMEQVFVALLEVVSAINIELLNLTERNLAVCRIIDNDRKCLLYIYIYMQYCQSLNLLLNAIYVRHIYVCYTYIYIIYIYMSSIPFQLK